MTDFITPTQADRDAAATWFTEYAGKTLEAECMRGGTADHWPLIQAFARHRQSHSLPGDVGMLPRLDDGLIEAAMLAHYGNRASKLGINGVDLTANGVNWTFRDGFKRMWAGVRKELKRRAALTPSPCPGDVGEDEQPGDYLRDTLLNIAAICDGKALHVEAASLRSTAAIVSEQLRKGQQTPEATQASAGNVKVLRGLLQEFVEAMERYQMDVDDDAPPRHRDMMERAYAALTPSALSGDAGEGWQPIETAPKDGRNILVIGLPPLWKNYPFVVFWDATAEDGEGWWRHTDPSLDNLYAVSDSITHWAEYPDPAALPSHQGAGEP